MSDETMEELSENGATTESGASASAEPAAEDASPTLSLEEQLAAAQEEAARNLEGWQRTLAEFANARRRMEKQQVDARTNATINVAGKLLPVLDDFSRALETVPPSIADDDWFTGFTMVHRKLGAILTELKIEPIEAVGQAFDPQFHEAVMQEPSDEHESGTVIREYQTGYKFGERVIRPSVVVIAA